MPAWKLPGYVVEGLLGRGGSGEVWRARVARSGDAVALKRIPLDGVATLSAVRREAALLATLEHPNLVRLHDLVMTDDAAVLVMDLAAGGSLAELLAARGRLAPGEVITALAPVAAALAHAHAASVVHGDVSAANVLFSEAGLPLLGDLGVARLFGERRPVRCTPAYVDPAVAAGAPPTARSDVFMLGGVALHALTGEPTWPSDADGALERARSGRLDDVAARLADAGVPEATAFVMRRALDLDPARRGTAADFALDLRHSGEPVAVELAAGRPRTVPRGGGPRHAARSPRQTAAAQTSRASARPEFSRPSGAMARADDRLPPTRMVAAPPRPVLPLRVDRRMRARRLCVCTAALAAAGAAAWAMIGWPGSGRDAAASTSTAAPASDGWFVALRALDSRRAEAYAHRDPRRFAEVYGSAALLRADTAQLTRVVPSGCVLTGVRTEYRGMRVVTSDARHAVVVASARLAAAALRCPGEPVQATRATDSSRLRIELVRTPNGPRIAQLNVANGDE
jgi:hypothetical protein